MKEFNFNENKFSLSIKVEDILLNENLMKEFSDLKIKKEFHITLLGGENRKFLESLENKENTKNKLFEILNKYNFNYNLGDYFLLEKDDLKSVVVLVKIEDLNNFFEDLNKEFTHNFMIPTPHITLFVSNSTLYGEEFRGFSVDDWQDLKKTKIEI